MRHSPLSCACLLIAAASLTIALPAQTLTFASPRQISVDPTSQETFVYLYGDFDGNGNTDLIVGGTINSVVQYKFLAGNGSGGFTPTRIVDLGLQQESFIADFNGDGKDDIVTLWPGCSTVPCSGANGTLRILLSEGGGKFTTGYTASLPASDNAVAGVVGDFNKDGRPDIAVVNYPFFESARATLMIFINRGDGSFTKTTYNLPEQFTGDDFLSDPVTGDFQGNGNQDLALTFYSPLIAPPCVVYTFPGDGTGNFGPPQLKYTLDSFCAVGQGALFAADLNHDDRTDLVPIVSPRIHSGNPLNTRVPSLLARKSGAFFWSSAVYAYVVYVPAFSLADLNGDGMPDLIFVSPGGGPNQNLPTFGGVYLGGPDGKFQTPHIPLPITGNNTIIYPSIAAVPLKTGDLPSLFIGNGAPTLELLINTTRH